MRPKQRAARGTEYTDLSINNAIQDTGFVKLFVGDVHLSLSKHLLPPQNF